MSKEKNPAICLYHTTSEENFAKIMNKGLDPTHHSCEMNELIKIKEEEHLSDEEFNELISACESPQVNARLQLDDTFPAHKDSIFFMKKEDDILPMFESITIEVPADKIPCRCKEANLKLADELWQQYYEMYSEHYRTPSQEEIWEYEKEYEKSIRPLDKKENEYITEVMCPCHIPPDIIAPSGSGKFAPTCPAAPTLHYSKKITL